MIVIVIIIGITIVINIISEMTPEIEACMVLSGEDDGTDTSDEEIDDEEVIYGIYQILSISS